MRILLLATILLLPTCAYAQELNPATIDNEAGLEIVEDNVMYLEFHDPGWMKLKLSDGAETEAYFYYELIDYEEIDRWQENELIEIAISAKQGLGIVRKQNGQFYKVFFDASEHHPIDALEGACLGETISTLDVSICYYESGDRWEKEQQVVIDYILNRQWEGWEELKDGLVKSQKSWQQYMSNHSDAYASFARTVEGTKYNYNSAMLKSELQKNRALVLESFFDGAYPDL